MTDLIKSKGCKEFVMKAKTHTLIAFRKVNLFNNEIFYTNKNFDDLEKVEELASPPNQVAN